MLSILPIDTGRYGTKEMLDIFREQKKINYQLEIEGAAAISQSQIGMIPKSVGKNIYVISKSGKITAKRIKQLEAKSDHDTAALVVSPVVLAVSPVCPIIRSVSAPSVKVENLKILLLLFSATHKFPLESKSKPLGL